MIVVVDDERTFAWPVDVYLRNANDALAFFARRFESPIVEPITGLWLDHDLGEGGDAIDVARFLVACQRLTQIVNILDISTVFVHSQNPVGARNLYLIVCLEYPTRVVPLPELYVDPWPT